MTLDGYIICEMKGKFTAKVMVNKKVIQEMFEFYQMYREDYLEDLYVDAYFKANNIYTFDRGKAIVEYYILQCIREDLPFIVYDLEK